MIGIGREIKWGPCKGYFKSSRSAPRLMSKLRFIIMTRGWRSWVDKVSAAGLDPIKLWRARLETYRGPFLMCISVWNSESSTVVELKLHILLVF